MSNPVIIEDIYQLFRTSAEKFDRRLAESDRRIAESERSMARLERIVERTRTPIQ